MVVMHRKWALIITIPAMIGVALIFFFSTFETVTYRTREGYTIEYRIPFSASALIPIYLLWTSSVLLILAIIPISYYFISSRLEEKLEKNMKVISKFIAKNSLAPVHKSTKMEHRDILLRFLNLNEKKVLEKLIDGEGRVLQSEINLIDGMTKLKTHRAVKDLERKSIIKTETYGKTNRIILSEDIKEFMAS